jgi:hypothetical protein
MYDDFWFEEPSIFETMPAFDHPEWLDWFMDVIGYHFYFHLLAIGGVLLVCHLLKGFTLFKVHQASGEDSMLGLIGCFVPFMSTGRMFTLSGGSPTPYSISMCLVFGGLLCVSLFPMVGITALVIAGFAAFLLGFMAAGLIKLLGIGKLAASVECSGVIVMLTYLFVRPVSYVILFIKALKLT